jgi:glycosyltransferase involved in cell wall biosynthesis
MSKDTSIIWMNVTSSESWKRPAVGVIRAERELCAELSILYGPRFKKCIWLNDQFIELEKASADNNQRATVSFKKYPLIYPKLPRQQALKFLAQAGLSLTPDFFKPCMNRFLIFLRPRVIRLIEKNWRIFFGRNLLKMNLDSNKSSALNKLEIRSQFSIFSPDDVLISVGLDWEYPYYKEFYKLKKNNDVRVITCCYDLIPVLYPQYCVNNVAGIFTSYFLEIADGSDLVLCISKQSEIDLNQLLDRTGGARPITQVFRLGDKVPGVNDGELSEQVELVINGKFILYVSSIERRKNHEVLYRAYHLLCKQGKKAELPKLVFVGMHGWGVGDLFKDVELDPMTHDMIIQINHVKDYELQKLYESALFCVFPSLYEGWGLPVGEALLMGKAVICSNKGSLPEVGGDLVRYVDPWSVKEWADELYRMSTDNVWRQEWIDKTKNKYVSHGWPDSAYQVFSIIERTISKKKKNEIKFNVK